MAVDHYENFPVASLLLPRRLRPAVRAIYRFARTADDIADEGEAPATERLTQLAAYRAALQTIAAGRTPPPALARIFTPLAATIAQHQLPLAPFEHLLSAFEQDVHVSRYADASHLLDYCTRSASPVGRLMLCLYRADTPEHLALSDAICTGLQLSNFWQDVALDWQKGRVYIPQTWLAQYGVTEVDIAQARLSPAWTALTRALSAYARAQLLAGAPLAQRLPGRMGLELKLVVQGGLRILERLDACAGDVFTQRPRLRAADWPLLLWRAATMRYSQPYS